MSRRLLLTFLVVGAVGAVCGIGTYSAFSSSTTSPSNSFSAGTVSLTDNHTASQLVTLSNAAPGTSASGCVKVTYGGSLPSTVRLYATSSGALAPYLLVTVTRGTGNVTYPGCTGFSTTGESVYISGQPAGVVFNSTALSSFPSSWSGTSDDPVGGTALSWTNGTTRTYKIDVQLDPSAPAAAQGQSASATFTWEARNQ